MTEPELGDERAPELGLRLAAGRVEGVELVTAPNLIEATQDCGAFVQISGVLKRVAVKISKICNDLRLLSSGPRAGLNEINLPPMQPGSSIMPGKVNPTQSEALTMVATRVFGNDATVAFAGTQGNFQLNVYKPVMAHAVLESIRLIADSCVSFDVNCAVGIEPVTEVIDPLQMLPAPGQGALAVECRDSDTTTADLLGSLDDTATRLAVTAERILLAALEAAQRGIDAGRARTASEQIQEDEAEQHRRLAYRECLPQQPNGEQKERRERDPFRHAGEDQRGKGDEGAASRNGVQHPAQETRGKQQHRLEHAHSRPLARFLGREKGLEGPLLDFGRHAGPRVRHLQDDHAPGRAAVVPRFDRQPAAGGPLAATDEPRRGLQRPLDDVEDGDGERGAGRGGRLGGAEAERA